MGRYDPCRKCQYCCKYFSISMPNDENIIHFLKTWGFEILPISEDEVGAVLNRPCQHLADGGCSIYENRPAYCKTYEGINDPVLARFCLLQPLKEAQE